MIKLICRSIRVAKVFSLLKEGVLEYDFRITYQAHRALQGNNIVTFGFEWTETVCVCPGQNLFGILGEESFASLIVFDKLISILTDSQISDSE